MKKCLAFALFACTACQPAIDNVDGLAGGELTSALTVPTIATKTLASETADISGELTADSVTSGSVTSSGAVTGSSFVLQRGAARVSFFGLIVGTVDQVEGETGPDAANTTPQYAVRQRACALAFPATETLPPAHVCTVNEAMAHALQAPDTVPETVTGGVVHSYGHYLFAAPDGGGVPQVVSDIGAMFVPDGGNSFSGVLLHRRAADGLWSLRIGNESGVNEPYVCCQ